jgi:hypothetical protein
MTLMESVFSQMESYTWVLLRVLMAMAMLDLSARWRMEDLLMAVTTRISIIMDKNNM